MTKALPLIVGLGSLHGDDRVGWHVAERLAESLGMAATIRTAAEPTAILAWLDNVTDLHICDGCQAFSETGRTHCWTWPHMPECVTQNAVGSHGVTLQTVLLLAERTGLLPARVTIWVVEIAVACPTMAMGSAALAGADSLARRIARELADA